MTTQTPRTICDGLLTCLGEVPFAILHALGIRVVTVTDDEIRVALRFVLERTKVVIEPSAAVPVAALLARKIPVQGRRVGVILSGGNLDVSPLFR